MSEQRSSPKHPIQVVARRTGLTPDLIRIWERRYRAVAPERSPSNRRLYSDEEIERFGLLRRCTLAGRRIGDVAHLPTDELRILAADDEAAASRPEPPGPPPSRPARADAHLAACLDAVQRTDAEGLKLALEAAAVSLSTPHLLEQLLMPLMTAIGDLWQKGSARAAHEHMATAVVRSFMGALTLASRAEPSAPSIVVTTPVGQLHELGALTAALASAVDGWNVTYMGPNLPAEEIAGAAQSTGARAVALSVVHPPDDPRIGVELRALRRLLGKETALLAGGAAAPSYAADLRAADASVHRGISTFRSELQTLRHQMRGPRLTIGPKTSPSRKIIRARERR